MSASRRLLSVSWSASPPTCPIPTTRSADSCPSSRIWATPTTLSSSWCRTMVQVQRVDNKERSTRADCRILMAPGLERCFDGSTRSEDRSVTTITRGVGRWRVTLRSGAGSGRYTRGESPIPVSFAFRRALAPAPQAPYADNSPHAIDVLPTVLELTGVTAPESIGGIAQSHLDGTSFAYLLTEDGAGAPGRHRTQHFEMLGSRAIYHDGWKAVAFHPVGPLYDDGLSINAPFDEDVWELYHVEEDPSETNDLAVAQPDKLRETSSSCGGSKRGRTTCCPLTTGSWKRSPTHGPITDARVRRSGTSRAAPRYRRQSRSGSVTGPTRSPSPWTWPTELFQTGY